MDRFFQNKDIDNQIDKKCRLRLLPVWLLLAAFCAFSQRAYAQAFNPLISFSVESCSLDVALEKLFAEYELNVAFSKAELSKIRIESYSCSYKSVEEVLTDLLKGTDYGFKRIGKQYVIRKNQLLEPSVEEEKPDNQPPVKPVKVKEEHKVDTVTVSTKTSDTIRIYDTLQIIRSVMRYDTIVRVEQVVETDTVYKVKYKGLEIHWPQFRDNGWFVTPSVSVGSTKFINYKGVVNTAADSSWMDLAPRTNFSVGLDAGYKFKKLNRVSVGMSVSYRSVKYGFALDNVIYTGDYYVNDTLDTYYTVHPSGDTTYQYILDSTYIPLETTNYSYRDINHLDYLGLGAFLAVDFIHSEHFRMFVKAGASMEILLSQAGSTYCAEQPFHSEITRNQVEPYKFSAFVGLGAAMKVANRIELTPEVSFKPMFGSVYRPDFMYELRMASWDFRLGLTYYF